MNRSLSDLHTALEKIQNAMQYIRAAGLPTVMVHGLLGRVEAERFMLDDTRLKVSFGEVLYDTNVEAGTLSLVISNLNIISPKTDNGADAVLVSDDVRFRMEGFGASSKTCTVQRTA